MMHHPNMHHHQPMSGHPPQHMPTHQGMPPGHQHVPPHAQMHRENRHVALTRVPMGPGQAGGGMGHGVGGAGGPGMHGHGHGHSHGHGQAAGGFGGMPVPHHPQQRPPHSHPIRAMPHHQPTHNHSVPPQQMKPLRRPYLGGGGYAGGGVMYPQPDLPPEPVTQPHHTGLRKPPSTSSPIISPPTKAKIKPDFGIPSQPIPQASSATTVSETAATGDVGAGGGEAAGAGADAGAAGDCEAGRALPPANSKEKTPMCLVNELARYNKIKHQYRLTSETGPAHKKVFTVTLRLGDTEEYTAEGSSIKRAQHAAAQAALAGTGFPPPPPRALPAHAPPHARHAGAVMPTVELNALAMKLCQPAVYTSVPPVAAPPAPRAPRPPRPPPYRLPPFMPNAYQRMLNPGLIYRVRVCVGGRAWLGEGATPQAARHDAAARALQDLRPPPDQPPGAVNTNPASTEGENGEGSVEILNAEVKSPVSLVHELALKRNLSVQFGVKSERGPPHMRVFVTTCTVGDMETEGEGNGKKVSKRRAAELMLAEMRRRWPAALLRARPPLDKRRPQLAKKKPRNLIKEGGVGSPETNGGGADNPISRLAVARHAVRARSPQYRVLEERGAARRREFLVQCDAPPHTATGLGPNKKTAKRRAAHNVLLAMEMANSGDTNGTQIGNPDTNGAGDAKTNITDPKRKEGDASAGGEGRQPVPGVLLMDYHTRSPQPAAPNGVSEPSATGGAGAGTVAGAGSGSPGAKDHLMYLAQLLGFTVQFSDFPKRNHGEYLSLVSLSTEPPVMCHGGGPSTRHSHEQCARAALRALALMGLDAPPPAASAQPAPMASMGGQTAAPAPIPGVISNGITE